MLLKTNKKDNIIFSLKVVQCLEKLLKTINFRCSFLRANERSFAHSTRRKHKSRFLKERKAPHPKRFFSILVYAISRRLRVFPFSLFRVEIVRENIKFSETRFQSMKENRWNEQCFVKIFKDQEKVSISIS